MIKYVKVTRSKNVLSFEQTQVERNSKFNIGAEITVICGLNMLS